MDSIQRIFFPIIGALYVVLFALELNPILFDFVHYFISPTRESLLFRAILVWGIGSTGLSVIFILFKGNWKQLLFVVMVYFIAYYIEGMIWFAQEKKIYNSGNYTYAQISREYSVANFSNFFEYDRQHVSGSNFFYTTYKLSCFIILFTSPLFTSRLFNFIFRKKQYESEVIDN